MLLPIGWETACVLAVLPFYCFPSLHPLYRGGTFLTITFCFPFPPLNYSKVKSFQHMYISSKEMQSNTTNAWGANASSPEITFSLCPPFSLTTKLRKSPGTLYDLSAQIWGEWGWSHSSNKLSTVGSSSGPLAPVGSCTKWDLGHLWKATRLTHWLTQF